MLNKHNNKTLKKKALFLASLVLVLAAFFTAGCGKDDLPGTTSGEETDTISVTGVSLNKTATTIGKGSTETLTATIAPEDASNKKVSWSSSNTDVATVTNEGLVTAVNEGTATITVKTEDGNKTAICTVTVTGIPVISGYGITDTMLDEKKVEIYDTDETLIASGTTDENGYFSIPVDETAKKSRSSAEITFTIRIKVYIDEKEFVSRLIPADDDHEDIQVNPITTGIDNYCQTQDDPVATWKDKVQALPEECKVLLEPVKNENLVEVTMKTSITLGYKKIINELKDNGSLDGTGDSDAISVEKFRETTKKAFKYDLSGFWENESYNSFVDLPFAKIQYKEYDGDSLEAYVYKKTEDFNPLFKITYTYKEIDPNQNMKFVLTKDDEDWYFIFRGGKDSSKKWIEYYGEKSDTEKYPSEYPNTYSNTTMGGKLYHTSNLPEITTNVSSVELSSGKLILDEGFTENLTASVMPDEASYKAVIWSSSNTDVAMVTNEGVVTAVAIGTATITVTTVDGEKTDTCAVTVLEKQSSPIRVYFVLPGDELIELDPDNGGYFNYYTEEIIISTDGSYDEYYWRFNGTPLTSEDGKSSITIEFGEYQQANNVVILLVVKDGVPYSKELRFQFVTQTG